VSRRVRLAAPDPRPGRPPQGDRRAVGKPSQLDEVLAPARRAVGEIIAGYTGKQREVLFDYFSRAAHAYQEAAGQLSDRTDW
jgi:hypothetical protein